MLAEVEKSLSRRRMPALVAVSDDHVQTLAMQAQIGNGDALGKVFCQGPQCDMNAARGNPLGDQSLGTAQKHEVLERQANLTTYVAGWMYVRCTGCGSKSSRSRCSLLKD